ncbi:hypothetical protein [Halopelagius longus]|uniref:Lipoprotein n=1 Tax=Halopelagius longus TaxID=1236180 RepID=A0A1H1BJP6_9EURY|nr:hypothetical protein [Halopelagius longus]RDI70812.1 hypothetical protein DWB78_03200 [Halopelagius longus]SDQ52141.1 hypothetical protein SAMN05216278_1828 [Halopelagius longus]
MNRRTFLRAGVALSCGLAGCLDSIRPPTSSSSDGLSCPSTVPRIENADFEGEFEMRCNAPTESETEPSDTALAPDSRSVSLPDAEIAFTLTNRRDRYFNANFYRWELQKRVDGEWYATVPTRAAANAGSSLAPDESHTWSVSVTNDNLGTPVEPVTADESLSLRALGGGTYAFLVVGSYGRRGQSPQENQPIIAYAAPFTLSGDALQLVPTNTVRDVTRDGNAVTVTVGGADSNGSVTVTKRPETDPSDDAVSAAYVTESVYGVPALRNALAHFEDGVEAVTVRDDDLFGTPLYRGLTFAYEGTVYEVTDRSL